MHIGRLGLHVNLSLFCGGRGLLGAMWFAEAPTLLWADIIVVLLDMMLRERDRDCTPSNVNKGKFEGYSIIVKRKGRQP